MLERLGRMHENKTFLIYVFFFLCFDANQVF
jgi:hypothetical protein